MEILKQTSLVYKWLSNINFKYIASLNFYYCDLFWLGNMANILLIYLLPGQRAKLVSDPVPKQPLIMEENIPIPRCALMPPNANSAQMLVWRPKVGKPLCIIPPVWKKDVPIEKQVPRYDSKLCRL